MQETGDNYLPSIRVSMDGKTDPSFIPPGCIYFVRISQHGSRSTTLPLNKFSLKKQKKCPLCYPIPVHPLRQDGSRLTQWLWMLLFSFLPDFFVGLACGWAGECFDALCDIANQIDWAPNSPGRIRKG